MNTFLSCDWGTTSFRLRLIEADTLKVIAEEKHDQGIAVTYRQWQEQGSIAAERAGFYTAVIKQSIAALSAKAGQSFKGIPVVLSGMASSTIGLLDMPYKVLPFKTDGSDLEVKVLKDEENPLIIISGACSADDVMRGEETKIVGCAAILPAGSNERLLLLPGTHPKHIFIKGDEVVDFKTYMTGEFFDLLTSRSILAASVTAGGDLADPQNRDSFINGLKAGQTSNLLHAGFMVRTNQVLKQLPPQQNYFYLSGLLIGSELKDINPSVDIYLVGGAVHTPLYAIACEVLGLKVLQEIDADEALVRGQVVVLGRA